MSSNYHLKTQRLVLEDLQKGLFLVLRSDKTVLYRYEQDPGLFVELD